MPIISRSTYGPPRFLSNPHLQTVLPSLFRKIEGIRYQRERIDTPDRDFLDLDWSRIGSERLAIILHGLEGDSHRSYILGMVRTLNNNGWDALAWNFRGCSGEPNRKRRFYHSGDTDDLAGVVSHVIEKGEYSALGLIGFSLGGNVVLKYLGERGPSVHPSIKRAVAFSVPCDLRSGAMKMSESSRRIYLIRFLRMLRKSIRAKMALMPGLIDDHGYDRIKTFKDFDERYTAPLHGFDSPEDYWEKASSKPFLTAITVPTLLVNAADDPFLAPPCYPLEEAEVSESFFLEIPRHGGHVGFLAFNEKGEFWSESRAVSFLSDRGDNRQGVARRVRATEEIM